MSLLDNLPHECTIRQRSQTSDDYGGNRNVDVVIHSGVPCWEQQAGSSEVTEFDKRGMRVSHKVFFATNYGLTEQHEILVTKRNGVSISNPPVLDVVDAPAPDASAGMGVLYRAMCSRNTGEDH